MDVSHPTHGGKAAAFALLLLCLTATATRAQSECPQGTAIVKAWSDLSGAPHALECADLVTGKPVLPNYTFANLGAPSNGATVYCSNCAAASPCVSGGTGTPALRVNGAWSCSAGSSSGGATVTRMGTIIASNAGPGNGSIEPALVSLTTECTLVTNPCIAVMFSSFTQGLWYGESRTGVNGLGAWHFKATVSIGTGHHGACWMKKSAGVFWAFAINNTQTGIDFYTTASPGGVWTLDTANVITNSAATWKDTVWNCDVWLDPGSGTPKMYFEGADNGSPAVFSIGLATGSANGKIWTEYVSNPIPGLIGQAGPDLHIVNGVYRLLTHNGSFPTDLYLFTATVETGPYTQVGGAPFYSRTTPDEGPNTQVNVLSTSQFSGQVADPSAVTINDNCLIGYVASEQQAANFHINALFSKGSTCEQLLALSTLPVIQVVPNHDIQYANAQPLLSYGTSDDGNRLQYGFDPVGKGFSSAVLVSTKDYFQLNRVDVLNNPVAGATLGWAWNGANAVQLYTTDQTNTWSCGMDAGSTVYCGSMNNVPFKLRTNNVDKWRIEANGDFIAESNAYIIKGGISSPVEYRNAVTTNILIGGAVPTILSGFGAAPSTAVNNGTGAFTVNVSTGGTATSGVIGLPTAASGWNCWVNNLTAAAAHRADNTRQTASTTTSATVENQTTLTGAAVAWTASDILRVSCFAY